MIPVDKCVFGVKMNEHDHVRTKMRSKWSRVA